MTDDLEILYNAMEISSRISFQRPVAEYMYNSPAFGNRANVVAWIRSNLPNSSWEIRDTTMQIFDTFLLTSFCENAKILEDSTFIAFAAAASVIMSSKLHSSRCFLTSENLKTLKAEDILFFERQILMKTAFRMSTFATPYYFAQYIVSLCSDIIDQDRLLQMMNTIIGEFWEDGASLLFAPSTIAISSAIVSLSMLRMDCSKLLDSLPDFLLPNRSYPFFLESDGKGLYLDLDSCVKSMERLPYIRTTYSTRSPNSVSTDFTSLLTKSEDSYSQSK